MIIGVWKSFFPTPKCLLIPFPYAILISVPEGSLLRASRVKIQNKGRLLRTDDLKQGCPSG